MILAFECYADEDVMLFLKEQFNLPITKSHEGGQGAVVGQVIERQRADVGLVDEDPGRSHHRGRDGALIVSTTNDVQVRRKGNRHLIILRPDLENCFRQCMDRLDLASDLPTRAQDLRRVLGVPGRRTHEVFRHELRYLYQESKTRGVQTFVTELEAILRQISRVQ